MTLPLLFVNRMFLVKYMKRKHFLLNFLQLKCLMRHTIVSMCDLGRNGKNRLKDFKYSFISRGLNLAVRSRPPANPTLPTPRIIVARRFNSCLAEDSKEEAVCKNIYKSCIDNVIVFSLFRFSLETTDFTDVQYDVFLQSN
ncbi:uncharacterized protein LOC111897269 [Lactuca sativa]|uniref:uncharacterized protein LOC111897269 n=1 Tax=Lactuca sativa TaxID=4236 RepID=UPI001C6924A9|nr:uncharacterized protein LOC111897269 [Lactuca sativa]XP_052620358.1 uncharacterized protein LOC111897269 [Lactuca sativa]XP_052620359.1 uncharacterized protein LOC111897269 [Lactuca sativa]XP_052620360.1 uncharacterized protein LOC111897269 [Lactuca sativa]